MASWRGGQPVRSESNHSQQKDDSLDFDQRPNEHTIQSANVAVVKQRSQSQQS